MLALPRFGHFARRSVPFFWVQDILIVSVYFLDRPFACDQLAFTGLVKEGLRFEF